MIALVIAVMAAGLAGGAFLMSATATTSAMIVLHGRGRA